MTELISGASKAGLSLDRLVGEHKVSFEINDILKCKNWDILIEMVSKVLFRKLENERSTIKTLTAIANKLDLGVDEIIRNNAMPYLDIRHLLIHAEGKADDEFCKKYQSFLATRGEPIQLTYSLVSDAREKIINMVKNYDDCVVAKNIVLQEDLQP